MLSGLTSRQGVLDHMRLGSTSWKSPVQAKYRQTMERYLDQATARHPPGRPETRRLIHTGCAARAQPEPEPEPEPQALPF